MITSIDKIKQFGIYKDFEKTKELQPFCKYNLFYGWNGSGKSTLARLFYSIQKKKIHDDFGGCVFEISLENGNKLTESNICDFDINIAVFNDDFIKENIDWNETVKTILIISEEKIEEQKSLKKLQNDQNTLEMEIREVLNKIDDSQKEINKFLSFTAKSIKEQFQVIDTKDNYYFSYNKTRLEKFIEEYRKELLDEKSMLNPERIKLITTSIKPDIKDKIQIPDMRIDSDKLIEARKRINKLLQSSIVTKAIERLANNTKLSNWIEQGLAIHKELNSTTCEFCFQKIPYNRLEELDKHFNKEYYDFRDKLYKAQEWLTDNRININVLPNPLSLYEELQYEFNQYLEEIKEISDKINSVLQSWIECLQKKSVNPFEILNDVEEIPNNLIAKYNDLAFVLQNIINQHNNKSENFQVETKKQKHKLELHYAAKAIKEFEYFNKVSKVQELNKKKEELINKKNSIKNKILELEKQLSNEVLGAEQFNMQLHKFLGHGEISLQFAEKEKGYRIIRTKTNMQAKNLSEGEKTAIAFVYFITKLKENGNDLSKTTVVIDDPISSFDSNNLFYAYSFLRNECDNIYQLFILTHNFVFFKLIRDWLRDKNNKKNNEKERAAFFTIEAKFNENIRKSEIKNANESILKYNSEYHYLFYRVYGFKDLGYLSLDEAFLVSNLSRKLMEIFLSFKFPKKRGNFKQLIEEAIIDVTQREKIYKFINKYSHSATIEIGDNTIDNLMGESTNIVKEILDVIKKLDPVHYTEMESICDTVQRAK